MTGRNLVSALALAGALFASATFAQAESWRVYVGTYTSGESEGIYHFTFDAETGKAGEPLLAVQTENPNFLALHPELPVLYAAGRAQDKDVVTAFSINRETGALTLLNEQPAGGSGPCHVAVTPDGKLAAVANYGDGSVSVYPVGEDGALGESTANFKHEGSGPDERRQQGPHAHSVNFDPTGQYLVVADLGIDKLMIYKRDGNTMVPNDPAFGETPPGGGPRHFAFHPSQPYAYVVNEMGNTVTAYAWDAETGALDPLQTAGTLPTNFHGNNTTAHIEVHPGGGYVYASNRGHDSIAIFAVDQETGRIAARGQKKSGGVRPRNFTQDPSGAWLLAANQDTHDIHVMKINPDSGALGSTGEIVRVPSPVCLVFTKP
ncbi:MAG: lactonase family protein [Candidatus Hydrogenedentes bacterium]|nr:lactonase family protein [Candidatus Hydrogenedentota bacterium]